MLLKLDDGDIDQQYTKVVPSPQIEDKMQRKMGAGKFFPSFPAFFLHLFLKDPKT